jgi:hypothetical protein
VRQCWAQGPQGSANAPRGPAAVPLDCIRMHSCGRCSRPRPLRGGTGSFGWRGCVPIRTTPASGQAGERVLKPPADPSEGLEIATPVAVTLTATALAGLAQAEFAYAWLAADRIHMGDLLPEISGGPAQAVAGAIVLDHVTPASGTTARAEQLLKPFVAEHKHGISPYHEPGLLVSQAPFLELFRLEQMEEVLATLSQEHLLRMGGAEELPAAGPGTKTRCCCGGQFLPLRSC